MKIFNSTSSKLSRALAAFGMLLCLGLLAATKPFDDKKREVVVLSTEFGDMTIDLFDDTPIHKENFLKLVGEGYYDGLLFHRVIEGFMIQGGDPASRNAKPNEALGRGGPGYTLPAEIEAGHIHTKGALAAARQGDQVNPKKESSGSQFYIVQGRPVQEPMLLSGATEYTEDHISAYLEKGGTPHLDGAYTVFGELIDGWDVIDSIAAQATDRGNRPLQDISMTMKIQRIKWP